nr:MAG TPA: hypothetical protein [Caudoviricetes sp.]
MNLLRTLHYTTIVLYCQVRSLAADCPICLLFKHSRSIFQSTL